MHNSGNSSKRLLPFSGLFDDSLRFFSLQTGHPAPNLVLLPTLASHSFPHSVHSHQYFFPDPALISTDSISPFFVGCHCFNTSGKSANVLPAADTKDHRICVSNIMLYDAAPLHRHSPDFQLPSKTTITLSFYYTVSTCSRASIFGAFQRSRKHKPLTARLKADIMPASGHLSTGQKCACKAQKLWKAFDKYKIHSNTEVLDYCPKTPSKT